MNTEKEYQTNGVQDANGNRTSISDSIAIQKHYDSIIAFSDDAIIFNSLDGIVSSWNIGAQDIFGYSALEMIGQPISDIFPEDKKNEENIILNKILYGEKISDFETLRIHQNGTQVLVSIAISSIRDQQGRIIGASNIVRDISARDRLEIVQTKFEAIIQSSDDAIIGKSLDGIITSWNFGAQTMFGYSAHEMIGKPMFVLLPDDRKNEEYIILNKLRKGEKIDHFETVRTCKDGRCIDVSVTISPIRNKHGDVVGASKIARDITAKKIMEKRLNLTSNVFIKTNEAIMIVDTIGKIIEVNEAFSHISGYSRKEVIGQSLMMLKSDYQKTELISNILESVTKHGHYQGEEWINRKNGEAYIGIFKVDIVMDSAGALECYIVIFSDITLLRVKQKELENLAHFDTLTSLPNRTLLSDRLHQAMASSLRRQLSIAVLYLDLDGFKNINDTYGHNVGDKLLIDVSHRMKSVIRDVDTLARIGGDEYVAILVDLDSEHECIKMIERILRVCAEPMLFHGNLLQISTSIGVTIYPKDNADSDHLIRHADRAMYEAKRAGKNRYRWFDLALDEKIQCREMQLARINQALVAGEFVLHYQPKVNMRTGVMVGVEALIRWNHPERGQLSPDAFLPTIENHPLSEAVGEWVISCALAQMDVWRKNGLNIPVSVNICARHLEKINFISNLTTLFLKYPGLNKNNFEFEILETSAFHDIQIVATIMKNCIDLGIRFAIDDFGTGYSSLAYLRHFPAETLKIDRSFICDILENNESMAIVNSILGLGVAFRRQVIAEGVETELIGKKLLDLGCELAQGYGISRPMPGDQVLQWKAGWHPYPSWCNKK